MAHLRPVRRSSVLLLLLGMLASGLAACGGSPKHGPTVAVYWYAIANVIVANRKDSRNVTHDQLVQVTWDPNRPDEFGVYFTDASADSRPGNRAEAEALATSYGFQFVDSPDETLVWKLPGADWMASIRDYRPGPDER